MRILITGGAGFIGQYLARRLHQGGHTVRILDNMLPQVHGTSSTNDVQIEGEVIRADVRDPSSVASALRGIEVVYHLAAETGVGQSQYDMARYVSTNTYGTAVVLQECVAAGVKQVVISSSRAIYGEGSHRCKVCESVFVPSERARATLDSGTWEIPCQKCGCPTHAIGTRETSPANPVSVYGVTKLQQEQLARVTAQAHDLPVTILRFFNVFGPGQSLANPYTGVLGTFYRLASTDCEIEVYEDGKMLRDFVYVEDIVEALVRSAGNSNTYHQAVNVGAGTPLALLDIARQMFIALGKKPRVRITGRYRVGDVRHAFADTTLLEDTLGFLPRVTFGEGLRRYVEWARESEGMQQSANGNMDMQAASELESRQMLRQGDVK
ncbi:SDR family NAD(P)-dependent oxidoreductase [soil metagenome]